VSAANSFSASLLVPAVDAARRALSHVDEDEIPARIRVVAKRSGKLPAPLALSLIAELDRNSWLRELALGELDTESQPGEGSASSEFLRREPGWEERLATITEQSQSELEERSSRRLTEELAAAKLEIERLRRQLRKAKRPTAQGPEKKPPPDADGARDRAKVEATLSSTKKALAASEAVGEELSNRVSELQLRVETLLRRRPEKSAPRAASGGSIRPGPVELARDLDIRLHALSVPPLGVTAFPPPSSRDPSEPPSIPSGIRPDRAEAIEWLLSHPGPLTVAVDGWNLAFQFKNPPGRKERAQVEAAVGRLSHKSAGQRKLLVLFDSRFDVEGAHPGTHPEVEVRFPASADEALIELAGENGALVVITSDRQVREETGHAGAIGLWGEALIDWIR
jgi:hypothetical protein